MVRPLTEVEQQFAPEKMVGKEGPIQAFPIGSFWSLFRGLLLFNFGRLRGLGVLNRTRSESPKTNSKRTWKIGQKRPKMKEIGASNLKFFSRAMRVFQGGVFHKGLLKKKTTPLQLPVRHPGWSLRKFFSAGEGLRVLTNFGWWILVKNWSKL